MSVFELSGTLAYVCPIPGTVLCFLVLVAYAIAAYLPESRPHLDRVTFRLLTYAMVFNVLYGVAFSVTASQVAPGTLCTFGAFAVNLTLSFSTFFTTCISLNLQLVLVHNVNGKMMEKYYVIGTTIVSLALTVPALSLGQFGWQIDNSACWFKNMNPDARLNWLIGTQSFWILFMATIETVCSTVILWYLVGYEIMLKTLRITSHPTHSAKTSPFGKTKWQQASQFRNVIIRIAFYPIISLIINYSTSILDIYITIHGVKTQLDVRLLIVDLCLYGVRTTAYGMLAMADPSFLRAVRAIRESRGKGQHSATLSALFPNFVGTNSTSRRITAPGQHTASIGLECLAQAESGGSEKSGSDNSSYQRPEQVNGSVTNMRRGDACVEDTLGDAVRRTGVKLNLEDEISRKLCRQL